MKIQIAARVNVIVWIALCLVTALWLLPGVRLVGVQFVRQGWILDHPTLWTAGWWVWLLAIFCWMWLLITLSWTYLPGHRVASMLQSGLLIMGALMLLIGVIVWMGLLPVVLGGEDAETLIRLVDMFALSLLGAGSFMGGIVTTWVALDLYRQRVLARPWLVFCLLAGLSMIPSPFLFPLLFPYHLLLAAACWLCWSSYLALLPQLPAPFSEYRPR